MFAVVAFAQSAVWLAEVADEVVAVLGASGAVLAIDEDLLGATVLAWGETLPDLFAMLAVARAGPGLTEYILICVASCLLPFARAGLWLIKLWDCLYLQRSHSGDCESCWTGLPLAFLWQYPGAVQVQVRALWVVMAYSGAGADLPVLSSGFFFWLRPNNVCVSGGCRAGVHGSGGVLRRAGAEPAGWHGSPGGGGGGATWRLVALPPLPRQHRPVRRDGGCSSLLPLLCSYNKGSRVGFRAIVLIARLIPRL